MASVLFRFFILVLLTAASTSLAKEASFSERTPGYFVDRYGYPKSSKDVTKTVFSHERHGTVTVNGRFNIKEFRSDGMRVSAVFRLPQLKLVAVTYYLNRSWTEEQIQAALSANGSNWRPIMRGAAVKAWRDADKTKAIYLLTGITFLSSEIVDEIERVVIEKQNERKTVPKF